MSHVIVKTPDALFIVPSCTCGVVSPRSNSLVKVILLLLSPLIEYLPLKAKLPTVPDLSPDGVNNMVYFEPAAQ